MTPSYHPERERGGFTLTFHSLSLFLLARVYAWMLLHYGTYPLFLLTHHPFSYIPYPSNPRKNIINNAAHCQKSGSTYKKTKSLSIILEIKWSVNQDDGEDIATRERKTTKTLERKDAPLFETYKIVFYVIWLPCH